MSIITGIFVVTTVVMWWPRLGQMVPWTKRAKGGVPLWMFLTLSLYVVVPFGHWVWINGGFGNPLVMVTTP